MMALAIGVLYGMPRGVRAAGGRPYDAEPSGSGCLSDGDGKDSDGGTPRKTNPAPGRQPEPPPKQPIPCSRGANGTDPPCNGPGHGVP
jgi:hypothetical protein